ncbi:MAG: hypothetical protein ACRD4F_01285, partial [Candidatus Angelobacter sp.]
PFSLPQSDYSDTLLAYSEAEQAIEAEIPANFVALMGAYLPLKRHGQEICKRTKPKCEAVLGSWCLQL